MNIFQHIIAEIELIRFRYLQKKELRWYKEHHPEWDIIAIGVPVKLSENAMNLLRQKNRKAGK